MEKRGIILSSGIREHWGTEKKVLSPSSREKKEKENNTAEE